MKYQLKKGSDEQTFIYTRLNLLDQQNYFIAEKQLWQSYIDISLTQRQWPVSIFCFVFKSSSSYIV